MLDGTMNPPSSLSLLETAVGNEKKEEEGASLLSSLKDQQLPPSADVASPIASSPSNATATPSFGSSLLDATTSMPPPPLFMHHYQQGQGPSPLRFPTPASFNSLMAATPSLQKLPAAKLHLQFSEARTSSSSVSSSTSYTSYCPSAEDSDDEFDDNIAEPDLDRNDDFAGSPHFSMLNSLNLNSTSSSSLSPAHLQSLAMLLQSANNPPATSGASSDILSSVPPSPSNQTQPAPLAPSKTHRCSWILQPGPPGPPPSMADLSSSSNMVICNTVLPTATDLYNHITQAHVRKKTVRGGPSDLYCRWLGCKHGPRPFSKRNHIVSHCRAHVDLWPNTCAQCERSFKWPHDLKKHGDKTNHKTGQRRGPVRGGGDGAGGSTTGSITAGSPQVPLTPVIPLDSPSGLNVQQQQNGAAETPRDLSLKSSATPPTTITTTPPPSMLSNSFQPQNFHHPPFPQLLPSFTELPDPTDLKLTIDSIDASLASMATPLDLQSFPPFIPQQYDFVNLLEQPAFPPYTAPQNLQFAPQPVSYPQPNSYPPLNSYPQTAFPNPMAFQPQLYQPIQQNFTQFNHPPFPMMNLLNQPMAFPNMFPTPPDTPNGAVLINDPAGKQDQQIQ